MEPHDEPEVEEIPEETLGEEDVVDIVDVEDDEEEEVEIPTKENHHEEDATPRGAQPEHGAPKPPQDPPAEEDEPPMGWIKYYYSKPGNDAGYYHS